MSDGSIYEYSDHGHDSLEDVRLRMAALDRRVYKLSKKRDILALQVEEDRLAWQGLQALVQELADKVRRRSGDSAETHTKPGASSPMDPNAGTVPMTMHKELLAAFTDLAARWHWQHGREADDRDFEHCSVATCVLNRATLREQLGLEEQN